MSIYYVRHGETDYNKAYLIQGSIDAPLNEVGMEQAHQIALKLKDIKFDAIYCSPLRRARQTVEAINAFHGLPIYIANELHEQRYGEMEGKSRKEEAYLRQRPRLAARYPKGESYLDVAARVFPFLDGLKGQAKKGNVLLVAHGGISRIVNAYFEPNMENEEFVTYLLANCEAKKYDYPD